MSQAHIGNESSTNLLVRFLDHSVDDDALRAFFCRYGTIVASIVQRDIHTGHSRGFGFVRFGTHDQAVKALEMGNDALLGRKHINVLWAMKQHDDIPVGDERKHMDKLFIRNVPTSITDVTLARICSQIGKVSHVSVHADNAVTTRPLPLSAQRNIAFVTFEDAGAAERAFKKMHNTTPFKSCGGIPLMCKLSENYQERERKPIPPVVPALSPHVIKAAAEENGSRSTSRINLVETEPAAVYKDALGTPLPSGHVRTQSESYMSPMYLTKAGHGPAAHPTHRRSSSILSNLSTPEYGEGMTLPGVWWQGTAGPSPASHGISPCRAPTHLYYSSSAHRPRSFGRAFAPPPSPRLAQSSSSTEELRAHSSAQSSVSTPSSGRYVHNPYAVQCLGE